MEIKYFKTPNELQWFVITRQVKVIAITSNYIDGDIHHNFVLFYRIAK